LGRGRSHTANKEGTLRAVCAGALSWCSSQFWLRHFDSRFRPLESADRSHSLSQQCRTSRWWYDVDLREWPALIIEYKLCVILCGIVVLISSY
jgi:hypothetical protein